MPALQYLNKEIHTAAGRRSLHDPRKTDLQRLTREARIQARKRMPRPAFAATESGWLEEGLHFSSRALGACLRQTGQWARRYPLQLATGAVLTGIFLGFLLRRR